MHSKFDARPGALALLPALLVVALAPGAARAVNPGVNVYITGSAITKAAMHILPQVEADIKAITIPGNKGSHFSYDPIKFETFSISQVQVAFEAPNHVLVNIVGLTLGLAHTHFDIFDKIGPVKATCGGSFWGSAVNTQVHLNASVIAVNGKPQLPDIINSEAYGSLSVDHKFSNDICKIADKIVDMIADINKVVENVIRTEVPKIIAGRGKDATNAALNRLTMAVKLDQYAELVYDLTANPEVDGTSLGLHLQGEIMSATNPKPWPITPPPLPTPKLGRDLELQISDYVFNTGALVFTQAGVLDIRGQPIPANTSVFEKVLPVIYNKCPNCPMTIDYGIVSAPVASFDVGDAAIRIDTSALNVTVVTQNASNPHWNIFDLGVSAEIDVALAIQGGLLKLNLGLPKFTLKMIDSFVGPFNVTLVSDFVDAVLKDVIIPNFDKKFPGIPLPSTGNVALDNPTLTQAAHSAILATDFHYTN